MYNTGHYVQSMPKSVSIPKLASYLINPIDPNPAISAHVVYPKSGHICLEKRLFFRNFQHFSK